MSKLLLLDGNALMHRAYHALPPLTSNNGDQINAVYGFISILFKLILEFKPYFIAVCFDTPKPTFRKSMYVGYQAKRPKMEDNLSSQFDVLKSVLKEMKISIYETPGYEADDLIGTISENYKNDNHDVLIVTGDRDILQLVCEKVKVYMPTKGISIGKVYAENDVVERMGVAPLQIPDLKALAGDSSDNYPGVLGIGPKTATQLINKYNNIEEVYSNLSSISESVAKKLAINAESAVLGKKLAIIVRDAPIGKKVNDSKWSVYNKDVERKFSEIGFKTLLNRAINLYKEINKSKQLKMI